MNPAARHLHGGCPWRGVVQVAEATAARGGAVWLLSLDCGHTAFRQRRIVSVDRALFNPATLAPKRVRCLMCSRAPTPKGTP